MSWKEVLVRKARLKNILAKDFRDNDRTINLKKLVFSVATAAQRVICQNNWVKPSWMEHIQQTSANLLPSDQQLVRGPSHLKVDLFHCLAAHCASNFRKISVWKTAVDEQKFGKHQLKGINRPGTWRCPLFWRQNNPPTLGLFQSKQGSFGFSLLHDELHPSKPPAFCPWKIGLLPHKESIIKTFQPSIFRCLLLVSGRVVKWNSTTHTWSYKQPLSNGLIHG